MSAQVEDLKGGGGDPTTSDIGEIETAVKALQDKSDDEKVEWLLTRAKGSEREDQRDNDVSADHGIRLFSRQKKQSLLRILTTLLLLTIVYGIQLVALYNLNRASSYQDVNVIVKWLERGVWSCRNPAIDVTDHMNLPAKVRDLVGGSEMNIFDMKLYGFCLSKRGQIDIFFNIGIGLIMIYLFLFFDLWFVIFDMPLTRNWVSEPHGVIMILGVLWLVVMNAAIITWLGVVSGFSVIANAADFYLVLFTSLQLFIIVVIDDTVLPAVRFLIEEFGRLDPLGNLQDEYLQLVTHGSQYYKPGYGHSIVKNLTGPVMVNRVIAFIALILMSTIIVAPAVVTIVFAALTFEAC
jgi:hypothetical protein